MSIILLSYKEIDVRITNISQSLPHKMVGKQLAVFPPFHRHDMKKLSLSPYVFRAVVDGVQLEFHFIKIFG